jgi:hypothetical protein
MNHATVSPSETRWSAEMVQLCHRPLLHWAHVGDWHVEHLANRQNRRFWGMMIANTPFGSGSTTWLLRRRG